MGMSQITISSRFKMKILVNFRTCKKFVFNTYSTAVCKSTYSRQNEVQVAQWSADSQPSGGYRIHVRVHRLRLIHLNIRFINYRKLKMIKVMMPTSPSLCAIRLKYLGLILNTVKCTTASNLTFKHIQNWLKNVSTYNN